jgi:hypothetical protein
MSVIEAITRFDRWSMSAIAILQQLAAHGPSSIGRSQSLPGSLAVLFIWRSCCRDHSFL